ncbi:MAG: GerMN domain-containing protein [Clostridium sp.]|nr:GerMN domain-containing protein [Clostridium sp.]
MNKRILSLLLTSFLSLFLISCTITNTSNSSSDNKNQNSNYSNSTTNPSENNTSNNSNSSNNTPPPKDPNINNENPIETINCRLFFFDSEKLNLYYVDKDLKIKDNALVSELTKELQTNTTSDTFLKLTPNVGIKSATLDKDKGILKVVFNKSYVNEMILGTATESGLLSSLVNTYGYNYGVNKVSIYFGDKLYTSLKGDLPDGYFNTSFSDATAYNSEISTPSTNVDKICRLYFYDGDNDCIYYSDTTLNVTDNALTTALTNALKTPPSSSFSSIPNTVNVISADLDRSKDLITVNLSKNYYDILSKVGSGSESSLLQTLAMTYSHNYNIGKVIILIDGKAYSGSHILLTDGETVNFDLSSAKKLN